MAKSKKRKKEAQRSEPEVDVHSLMDEVVSVLQVLCSGLQTFSFAYHEEMLVYTVEVLAALTRFTYDKEAR